MTDNPAAMIRLDLELSAHQPELLEGLEQWLRLGLISDAQVLTLAQTQLTCALPPDRVAAPSLEINPTVLSEPTAEPLPAPAAPLATSNRDEPEPVKSEPAATTSTYRFSPEFEDFDDPRRLTRRVRAAAASRRSPAAKPDAAAPTPPLTAPVGQWLNRLMNELSVVWLLGLGVFLVVLSSAVLAATQWAQFSAVGQYFVLLTYTLIFWGIGVFSSRNDQLQLTARTLQVMTLLLVPLNFWAMDALQVGGSSTGILVAAIAVIALTLVVFQVMQEQHPWVERLNAISLAYLHLGWGLALMPLLAIYGGVLFSGAVAVISHRGDGAPVRSATPATNRSRASSRSAARPIAAAAVTRRTGLILGNRWSDVGIFFALGLLCLRGLLLLPSHQWGQLSLAFGLYGAVWVWLGQRHLVAAGEPAATTTNQSRAALETSRMTAGLGRAVMWWGWLTAIGRYLWQAGGISILGLALRIAALQRLRRRWDLLMAYAIAVQLAFVSWELLPLTLRQSLRGPFSAWATANGGSEIALLGLSFFPFVIGMAVVADRYWQRQQVPLAQMGEAIAIATSALLAVISTLSPAVLVVNLGATTITAVISTLRRSPPSQWRILVSQGVGLAAIAAAINYVGSDLSMAGWAIALTSLAVLWLLLSKALPGLWRDSSYVYGLGLSAAAFTVLSGHLAETDFQSPLGAIGLAIPLTLGLIGRHQASLVATGVALLMTLNLPWPRLLGLGTATTLTLINSRYERWRGLPFITVGLGLSFIVFALLDGVPTYPRTAVDWCVVTAGLAGAVWLLWRCLSAIAAADDEDNLATFYREALDIWGHLLTMSLLLFMSFAVGFIYEGFASPAIAYSVAQVALLAVLAWRYWGTVEPISVYLAGWGVELLVAQVLTWQTLTPLALALPTLGLGAIAVVIATRLPQTQAALQRPLCHLTLAYTVLALGLRSATWTAWTGGLVIGAALLVLAVSPRLQLPQLRWLALFGLSAGSYELVLYQLSQASGGNPVDGVIMLAGVSVVIMVAYQQLAVRFASYLPLSEAESRWAAHAHWLIASLLMLRVVIGLSVSTMPSTLAGVGLLIAAILIGYALQQGRRRQDEALQATWIYSGLIELIGWFVMLRFTVPALQVLDSWWGVVACVIAVPIDSVPQITSKWPPRPWRVMAIAVPLATTLATAATAHIPTLWVLAGFYAWLAWHHRQVRLSYLSVGCITWAIWVWLDEFNVQDWVITVLPVGLALLYAAQVDPAIRHPDQKNARHGLRLIATGLILLTALSTEEWTGLPVGLMALGAIAAGLLLRIRAFLYVGTIIFVINAVNQLVLLNPTYPFMKWIVGILVGTVLIWIAADFERRRQRWIAFAQTWLQNLSTWE
ncbi:MAG: hypothetical protein AAFR26_26695 [Cyanobacteria bacterium J06626_4]